GQPEGDQNKKPGSPLVVGGAQHAETSIPPYRHIPSATEDGESSVVDGRNETQQFPAGAGAETPVGKGATGKRSRRGRRRKARSMGRYPFLEASSAYLEFVRPFVAELTVKERGRKLRMIAKALADRGVSSHPAKWGELEIGAFVAWMKESGFEPEYQAKLLQYVRGLLRFVGNPVLERMKGARIVRLPSKAEKPVYVKDDAWYAETMAKVEGLIPNESGECYSEAGWRRRRAKTFAEAGIARANFRVLRPSFAQRLKDRGAPIEAVSKALRHSSTATTERFYARIRTERAW